MCGSEYLKRGVHFGGARAGWFPLGIVDGPGSGQGGHGGSAGLSLAEPEPLDPVARPCLVVYRFPSPVLGHVGGLLESILRALNAGYVDESLDLLELLGGRGFRQGEDLVPAEDLYAWRSGIASVFQDPVSATGIKLDTDIGTT